MKFFLSVLTVFVVSLVAQAQNTYPYPIPVKAQAFYQLKSSCVSVYKETRQRIGYPTVEKMHNLYTTGDCPIVGENSDFYDKTYEIPAFGTRKIAGNNESERFRLSELKDLAQNDGIYFVTRNVKTERLPEKQEKPAKVESVMENLSLKAMKEPACLVFVAIHVSLRSQQEYGILLPQAKCTKPDGSAFKEGDSFAVDFEKVKYLTKYSHIAELERGYDPDRFYIGYEQ